MNITKEEMDKQNFSNNAKYAVDNSYFKPKCPYHQETQSNHTCPYFMMANNSGPPGYGNVQGKSNWAGLTSMILGIITISMCWLSLLSFFTIIFLVMSVLAIIFGGIGLYISHRSRVGKAAAIAGLVLGILSLVLTILFFVLYMSLRYY